VVPESPHGDYGHRLRRVLRRIDCAGAAAADRLRAAGRPRADQINVELPPGSTLAQTRVVAEQARLAAMEVAGVKGVFSSIGGGSSGDAFAPGAAAEARRAVLTLTTLHRTRPQGVAGRHRARPRQARSIPGARFTVGPPDTGVKMQLVLRSEDPVALTASAQRWSANCARCQRHRQRQFERLAGAPRDHRPSRLCQAADLGVTAAAIGETVRVATAGDYDQAT
jgi:multidrug efflux pump subunit AcrB